MNRGKRLTREIGELEVGDLQYIWQPPSIAGFLEDQDLWILYGRKGAGKSTCVTFLKKKSNKNRILAIDIEATNLFQASIAPLREARSESGEIDMRLVLEDSVRIIEFVCLVQLMKEFNDPNSFTGPGKERERIYKFLAENQLDEKSTLNRAATFLGRALKGYKKEFGSVEDALSFHLSGTSYGAAKAALWNLLKKKFREAEIMVLAIDNIDPIGFSHSESDRLFVEALMAFCGRMIEVGTPVSPGAPLADPGVRNYRTGLLRKRAFETSSDTECQNRLPMQAGSVTPWSGSTWPVVSALLALLPAHSFAL